MKGGINIITKKNFLLSQNSIVYVFVVIMFGLISLNYTSILSDSVSSAMEAIVTTIMVILIITSVKNMGKIFFVMITVSVAICLINRAAYMISGTMMTSILYIVLKVKNIKYCEIIKKSGYITLFLFFSVVLINLATGWNSNNILMWRVNEFVYRKSLGFFYPNTTMLFWLAPVICILYTAKKIRVISLAMLLSTFLIYLETLSRTTTFVVSIVCIIFVILGEKINYRVSIVIPKLLSMLPFLFFFLSLVVLFQPINETINSLLSGRIELYKEFYSMYGIHFLKVPELENAMFDNGYLQALLAKGIIFTSQLLIILWYMCFTQKKISIKAMCIYTMYLCVAFTETSLQHFELFIPLALIMGNEKNQIT